MDGQRFDLFTRLAADGLPRRRLLKLLAAGVVAGIAGRRGLGPVSGAAARQGSCIPDVQACLDAAEEQSYEALETCQQVLDDCTGDPNAHQYACGAAYLACVRQVQKGYEREVKRCRNDAHVCCPSGLEACGDDCCDPGQCETCQNGTCVSTCDTANCETCVPGTGQCAGCDASQCQECVNGACSSFCTKCQQCTGGAWPICEDFADTVCPDPCQDCDPATGTCVARDCGDCQQCQGGACVPIDCGDPCAECVGNACQPKQCPPGHQCVDGQCTCQVSCPPPMSPNSATCACECPTGQTECNGACVDTQTDPANCGACGVTCTGGKTYQGGSCVCPTGTQDCNGVCQECCVDADCGQGGQVCQGGSCVCLPFGGVDFERCGESCCPSDSVCCSLDAGCCSAGTSCCYSDYGGHAFCPAGWSCCPSSRYNVCVPPGGTCS
jgi:hypothetical protein